ncbi:MAG: N-acetyltransferase [Cryomorphaceae bacterium]|nr:MAG: N-acetyltransferase [Cryomorphaceae bacterium]
MSSVSNPSLPASRRISFLPPDPDLALWLFGLHQDYAFTRHLCYSGWGSPSETASYLLKELENHHHLGYGQWLLKDRESGALIGLAGFHPPEHRVLPELSYRLAPLHWRKGLGTETVETLVQFGFTQLGFEGIEAQVKRENEASIRILLRVGFEQINPDSEMIKLFRIKRRFTAH